MISYNRPSLNRIADRKIVVTVIIICIIAGVFPFIAATVLSFCFVDDSGVFHFGSLEGYRTVFAGGRPEEFRNIVIRAAVVTAITMFLSVFSAYWVANIRRFYFQTFILAFLVIPWLVSDMLRAFGWQLLLSPIGPISEIWNQLTKHGPLEELRYNFGAVAIGIVSSMLPAGILSVYAAIPHRDRSEWLAAKEIGGPWHVFALMALGRARLGIVLGAWIVFILSCFASAEVRFLGGPNESSIQSIAASLVNDSVPAMLSFGTLLVVFAIISCLLGVITYRMFALPSEPQNNSEISLPIKKNITTNINIKFIEISTINNPVFNLFARYLPSVAYVISITLCCAPLTIIITEAFRRPSSSGMQWTLANFISMASSDSLIEALINSVSIAVAVSLIVAVISFILSLVAWDYLLQKLVLLLIAILVVLPGDAYSISLIQILKIIYDIEGGWELVVLSHVIWAIPFATGTLLLANQHINGNMLESALEYSKSPITVIFQIIGRINLGRISGVAILAGTLSLNEYLRCSYLSGGLLLINNEVHGRLTAGLLPQNRGIFATEFIIFIISIFSFIAIIYLTKERFTSSDIGIKNQ